ncbi:MAG: hypothetical protein Q4F60_00315, partial [Candidatus Saccharibacteria bacterium]|nr:hypothetical protein [Candidatus Saccharibacteria bacterium]
DDFTLTRGAINAVILAVAVLGIIRYKKIEVRGNKFFVFSIIATFLVMGIIMYSNLFPWGKLYNLFWSIQFPFRLQVMITFGASALAGMYLGSVSKTEYPAVKWLFLGSSIMLWTMVLGMKGTEWGKIEELKAGNGVIYDYVWEGYGHQREYLPVKTDEKWVRTRGDEVVTKSGNVVAKVVENNTPELVFRVSGKGEVELPRICYLGYKIQNTKTGEVVEYKESENGMILAEVDEGEYQVSYEGTTAGKVANALAGITVVILAGFFGKTLAEEYKNNKKKN